MPVPLPPPEFDHPPAIPVIEQVIPKDEITSLCAEMFGPPPKDYRGAYGGCTKVVWVGNKVVCKIWFNGNPDVLRHERGHCNGWQHEMTYPFATVKPAPKVVMNNPPVETPSHIIGPNNSGILWPDAASSKPIDYALATSALSEHTDANKKVEELVPFHQRMDLIAEAIKDYVRRKYGVKDKVE